MKLTLTSCFFIFCTILHSALPPTNVRVSPTIFNHAARVSWDASVSTDVASYRLYRTTTASFNQVVVVATNTTGLDYLDLSLDNNVTYYYRLTSMDQVSFESLPSVSTQIWTHPPAPTGLADFRVAAITTSTVRWAWTPGSVLEGAQHVIRLSDSFVLSPELAPGTSEYTETGFMGGEFISARSAVASNIAGSQQSVSAYTYALPLLPDDFRFGYVGTSVTANWSSMGNVSSVRYFIQRSLEQLYWFTLFETTSTSILDTSLPEGTTIHYRLRSENAGQVSTLTGPAISTVTARMPPSPVTDLIAYPGNKEGKLNLRWTATGEDGLSGLLVQPAEFRIYWSLNSGTSFTSDLGANAIISTSALPGSAHGYEISDLAAGSTYYFALFIKDNDLQFSGVSNIASSRAQIDITSPSAISDLSMELLGDATAQLRWTSPGDDGMLGLLSGRFQIGIAYDSATLADPARFQAEALKVNLATTAVPSTPYTAILRDLVSEKVIYFGVRSFDESNNVSTVSNIVRHFLDNVGPVDITSFTIAADTRIDNLSRLSWFVPLVSDASRLVLLRNALSPPLRSLLVKGRVLAMGGSPLEDGSVVLSTMVAQPGAAMAYNDLIPGINALYATYYYLIVSVDIVGNISPGRLAASRLRENVAPRHPSVPVVQILEGGELLISWRPPVNSVDGSSVTAAGSEPRPHEISIYEIYASSSFSGPWALAKEVSAMMSSATLTPAGFTYVHLRAVDMFGNRSEESSVMDSLANVYALTADSQSYVALSASLAGFMRPESNPYKIPLTIKTKELAEEKTGVSYTVIRSWAQHAETGQELADVTFPEPSCRVVLHYASNSMGEVTSRAPFVSKDPVLKEEADRQLALYWDNGLERTKIYGTVNKETQTVEARVVTLGTFYIQKLFREAGFDFDISQVEPRIITPNDDGLNDVVILRYSNPKDVKVTGRIFDLTGGHTSDLRPGPVADSKIWDGKDSNNQPVSGGVYVFQLDAEGQIYNGTVVVAR